MAEIIQTIKLNLIDTGIIDSGIRVKQGDSGISFIFDVNYAGKKVFEAGNLPTIVFKRSDGVSIVAECTVENDNYIYTIVGNELEQAGDLLVDLKFTWGGRESTCTARLYVVPDTIEKDVNPSDVYTNTVTIDDINEGVAKTKQYRDEAEQFRNEAEQFTPTGYQQLVTDVDGMKTSKQDTLISGTNVKTINGESILGDGNIEIQGGGGDFSVVSDEWDASTTYTVGVYCIYNNTLWKCLVQNSNVTPAEGTYWKRVSVGGELTDLNSDLAKLDTVVNNGGWKKIATFAEIPVEGKSTALDFWTSFWRKSVKATVFDGMLQFHNCGDYSNNGQGEIVCFLGATSITGVIKVLEFRWSNIDTNPTGCVIRYLENGVPIYTNAFFEIFSQNLPT